MSVILKGIDMPKGTEGMSITFYTKNGWRNAHILDVDQAIQIPKGHGDIKDINIFLKDKCLYEYTINDAFNKKYAYLVGIDAIYEAPTILESEEE